MREMNGRGRNSATESSGDSVVGDCSDEGGPAGSFDDRSFGGRRRSLIIVGSRDYRRTRKVDEEMD